MPSPVDETGSPSIDAANTVNALDRSMTKPREGVNSEKCHFKYRILYFRKTNTPTCQIFAHCLHDSTTVNPKTESFIIRVFYCLWYHFDPFNEIGLKRSNLCNSQDKTVYLGYVIRVFF